MRDRASAWIALLTAGAVALHLLMLVFGHANPVPAHPGAALVGHHATASAEEDSADPAEAPQHHAEVLYACLAVLVLAGASVAPWLWRRRADVPAAAALRAVHVFAVPWPRARSPVATGVLLRV